MKSFFPISQLRFYRDESIGTDHSDDVGTPAGIIKFATARHFPPRSLVCLQKTDKPVH